MKREQVKAFRGEPEKKSEIWPREVGWRESHSVGIWRFSKSNLESDPRNILHTSDTDGVLILFSFLCP